MAREPKPKMKGNRAEILSIWDRDISAEGSAQTHCGYTGMAAAQAKGNAIPHHAATRRHL